MAAGKLPRERDLGGGHAHRIGDSTQGVHRFGSCLRQADVPHIARTDHLCDGSDGLLDWYVWVYPAEAVGVDVIGAEASQG